jgi:hypothetical protein
LFILIYFIDLINTSEIKLNRNKKQYLIATIILFTIELLIGFYVHDKFIRPFIGDFLVVILLYCFVKSIFNIASIKAAIYVLLFAYFVEIMQGLKFVELIGLSNYKIARILIGTTFSWTDIVCYTIGILVVIIVEKLRYSK